MIMKSKFNYISLDLNEKSGDIIYTPQKKKVPNRFNS